MFVFLLG